MRNWQRRQQRFAYLALAVVCVFWGTTYLGIRISLEALPPFTLIAIRYTLSGVILLAAAALAGAKLPSGRELILTSVCGIIAIGIGNSCLAIAETWVPSGLTAVFFTTCPFWMVGLEAILPGGRKPHLSTLGGLSVGLAGVLYLVLPPALREGMRGGTLTGFLLLQLSAAGWATGSLLQKRVDSRTLPFVSGAVQQLAAGLAMFLPAMILERSPVSLTLRPAFALLYLVIFGSIIGFSSFSYSMARLPVAIVSIYTFVNPAVAVFLGWLFFREPFGSRGFVGMAIILVGVAMVRWSESKQREPTRAEETYVNNP